MIKPSFNANVNDKVKKKKLQISAAEDEEQEEQLKQSSLLQEMESAISRELRSTREERKEIRKHMKDILLKLSDQSKPVTS